MPKIAIIRILRTLDDDNENNCRDLSIVHRSFRGAVRLQALYAVSHLGVLPCQDLPKFRGRLGFVRGESHVPNEFIACDS